MVFYSRKHVHFRSIDRWITNTMRQAYDNCLQYIVLNEAELRCQVIVSRLTLSAELAAEWYLVLNL